MNSQRNPEPGSLGTVCLPMSRVPRKMHHHAEPQTTRIVITAPLVCATCLRCLGVRKMRRCCNRSTNRIRRKGADPSRRPPIASPIGMLKKLMHDRIHKLGETVNSLYSRVQSNTLRSSCTTTTNQFQQLQKQAKCHQATYVL
jgi:hypothetical protein